LSSDDTDARSGIWFFDVNGVQKRQKIHIHPFVALAYKRDVLALAVMH
jgi:hypothetical protein